MLSVLLLKSTQNNSILLKQESVLNGENIHGLINNNSRIKQRISDL